MIYSAPCETYGAAFNLMDTTLAARPARPHNAASLILLRNGAAGLEVLIGRRGAGARFMPGRYVFPGGRTMPSDCRRWDGESRSESGAPSSPSLALVRAALRETFEETGLIVARPAARPPATGNGRALSPIEEACRARGVAPAPDLLQLVGRAITPTLSPIRFHARFFVADGRHAVGELTAGEELDDVRWHAIDAEPPGAMQNVTKFMLRCAVDVWYGTAPAEPPLYRHIGKRVLVSGHRPAR